MRTWWPSTTRRFRLVDRLALMLLMTISVLAVIPSGSFDDLVAVPSRSECGYLKIFRWRNVDPKMVVPRPSDGRPGAMPEFPLSPYEERAAAPESAPSVPPLPSPDTSVFPSDCHPIPRLVPIAPAAP